MTYNEYKQKPLAERPEVKQEYEALGPQYEAIRAAIRTRKETGLTQKQLAEKMGTKNMAALTIFAVTHGIVKAEDI